MWFKKIYLSIVNCVKSVRIRRYSGPHFSRIFPHSDWIRLYLSVFSLNTEKCGKNADQNTSKYGLFLRSGVFFEVRSWLSHGLHLIKQVYGKCMKLKSHNMFICHKGLPEVVLFMNVFMHHIFLRSCCCFFG